MIGLEVSSGVTRILICGNSRGQSYYIAFIHEKMSQLAQLVFIFKFRYNVCSRFLCKCDSADGKVVARKKRLQFASDYSKKSNSCLQQHRLHNTYATCAVARPRRCLFTNRTIINGCNLRSDPPPALYAFHRDLQPTVWNFAHQPSRSTSSWSWIGTGCQIIVRVQRQVSIAAGELRLTHRG